MAPESTPTPALEIRGLTVVRSGAPILEGFDLVVPRGGPYAIVGESGAGKTTLLMALLGLLPPAAGTVRVSGRDITGLPPRRRAELAGLVFQDYQLFPHLTVLDNVTLAPRLHGRADPEATARVLLDDLGLGDLADRYPHALSGGQRQRVAIARSLALAPEVLFFDEPTAALDPRTTGDLAALLDRLNATSQVVVVSHDWPFLEGACPHGALLERGRLAAEGPLESLRARAFGTAGGGAAGTS
ncbi:MAG: hypothetical protein CVU56_18300 [Deltaproteobacteria bacterium HGW-Deltaproteobacteria-14]|nr:MAG: hypothetical protein CVU56_18300 [Deltaproteobacteria bacterium HGW-Deltaproteobacteria-14]